MTAQSGLSDYEALMKEVVSWTPGVIALVQDYLDPMRTASFVGTPLLPATICPVGSPEEVLRGAVEAMWQSGQKSVSRELRDILERIES